MAEAGFLDQKRVRPGTAATVVLMHGAAIAALLLAKNPEVMRKAAGPIDIFDVFVPPPPPPAPRPPRPRIEQETNWTSAPVPSPVPSPFQTPPTPPSPPPDPDALASNDNVRGIPEPPPPRPVPDPPAPPVRVEAQLVSGDLQPPYPTSEQRAEREGRVVIRITIGTDGRVAAAEKVSATSDAFYEATARHARARWRFRPATVDGRPVEARRTMTVVFRLDG